MTKEEYILWKPKFDAAMKAGQPWNNLAECHAADRLVRETALANMAAWADKDVQPAMARDIVKQWFTIHYGSVEVDQALQAIRAYPDWV